jgi:hypothetical protein
MAKAVVLRSRNVVEVVTLTDPPPPSRKCLLSLLLKDRVWMLSLSLSDAAAQVQHEGVQAAELSRGWEAGEGEVGKGSSVQVLGSMWLGRKGEPSSARFFVTSLIGGGAHVGALAPSGHETRDSTLETRPDQHCPGNPRPPTIMATTTATPHPYRPRNSSHSRTRSGNAIPSRPTTPLRPPSRTSLRASQSTPSGQNNGSLDFPLTALEPAFAELSDSMADLEANMMHLQLLNESLGRFNENFGAFLYGMNMSAFCVDFPEVTLLRPSLDMDWRLTVICAGSHPSILRPTPKRSQFATRRLAFPHGRSSSRSGCS